MRVFALSDLHIDFSENRKWLLNLSTFDFTEDALLLAGDISHIEALLVEALRFLKRVFKTVIFVPGNHDLWTSADSNDNSLKKFERILTHCERTGVQAKPTQLYNTWIIPLYAWYDYSFGAPSDSLKTVWTDYQRCHWPDSFADVESVTNYFVNLNYLPSITPDTSVITMSHFLPTIAVMPGYIPRDKRFVYPVLGSNVLMRYIDQLDPIIHMYGHSHVNNTTRIRQTRFINNAFGYPREKNICSKELLHIYSIEEY